jgi:hypothetical protein
VTGRHFAGRARPEARPGSGDKYIRISNNEGKAGNEGLAEQEEEVAHE